MCKRFIAIPLLCLVVIMAACPFSVYAVDPSSPTFPYPVNGLSGDFNMIYSSRDATGDLISGSTSVSFGYLWTGLFLIPGDPSYDDVHSMGYRVAIKASVVLNVTVGGDLYIAVPANVSYWTDVDNFNAYRYSAGDYGVDFNQMTVITYTPDNASGTFVRGTGTGDLDVNFMCYRGVPAGTYRIELDFYKYSNTNPICFGIYGDTRPSMNGYVDTYVNGIINGDIDYPNASQYSNIMSELREIQQSQSSDNVDLSILRELEYQSSVMYFHDQMDAIFADMFPGVPTYLDTILEYYLLGDISESDLLTSTTGLFEQLLTFCSSPDDIAAASSFADCLFSRLEFVVRMKAGMNMDQAISDDEVGAMEDYYESESELIEAFDQARFQAQLDFDTWFTLLPPTETIEYKKIFDYILNDSPIKNYIMIPVSMGLVTILLGTGIRFVGSKRGEDND